MSKIQHFIADVLRKESEAILKIPITSALDRAVQMIAGCSGKVFTTGIGKAGYIARKSASTFCTTGTPAAFIHPSDSSHGDVGAIAHGDILIAISNSGKTREVLETVRLAKLLRVSGVIALTATEGSPLSLESDVTIPLGIHLEACPMGLTPSTSVAALSAITDALALAVMTLRDFDRSDFAVRHHGGYLGEVSRGRVKD